MKRPTTFLLTALLILPATVATAETIRVAVAANFVTTAEQIAEVYETETGHDVAIISGSTGKLYAQITHGAPFDVFLAADRLRPARLLADGRAVEVASYASGIVTLVQRDQQVLPTVSLILSSRLAIADPNLAPYGAAAIEVLTALGLDPSTLNIVYGENIAQVAGFYATGNVDLAMIAESQLADLPGVGAVTPLDSYHAPVLQDAALIRDTTATRGFFDLLLADEGQAIIRAAGYRRLP